ncbi:MAG: hypothetical protein ACLTOJ_00210, partial [[Clostridium] symbiosum]
LLSVFGDILPIHPFDFSYGSIHKKIISKLSPIIKGRRTLTPFSGKRDRGSFFQLTGISLIMRKTIQFHQETPVLSHN